AMTADDGQLKRRKQEIELGERTPAHQRKRSAGAVEQTRERGAQLAGDEDLTRGGSKIEDGAVHIEQNGNAPQVLRGGRKAGHRQFSDPEKDVVASTTQQQTSLGGESSTDQAASVGTAAYPQAGLLRTPATRPLPQRLRRALIAGPNWMPGGFMPTKRPGPRLDIPAEDTLTAPQRALKAAIASGPRGTFKFSGPFAIWLHAPELGQLAQALGAHCRYGTSLSPRQSEFAILATARTWRAQYEWQAHAPMAEKAGVDAKTIRDLKAGRYPKTAPADERAIYDFVSETY